jgi:glyoxylase-like metal-dependent hydrolase (beta-lactamase superfamily II)
MLVAADPGPVRYVILTCGCEDVVGGVMRGMWASSRPEVLAADVSLESWRADGALRHFRARMTGRALDLRGLAQSYPVRNEAPPADLPATRVIRRHEQVRIGDLTLHLIPTPPGSRDDLIVWTPELRVAFVAHHFQASFPPIYTLRGEPPRSAVAWSQTLDTVLALQPELVLAHPRTLRGRDEVRRELTRLRDAITYVHDRTVEGMEAGRDVSFTR